MKLLTVAILSIAGSLGLHAADQKKKDDPSQIGNRDIGKCLNFYSIGKELSWGKQLAEEVSRQAKLNDDPIITEYVNRLGQSLARNSDSKMPFTFQVIDGDDLNAFALPGGYIFVYSGLIKLASEEDEFAGALAHEIAHVAARHMTCRATQSKILTTGSAVPRIFLGGIGGVLARQAVNAAVPMTLLSFTRHDESEADFLGVQYMYAAGYDPTGAVSIFEKLESLQKTKPGTVAKILSTHPLDADRIEKTEQEIQRILPARDHYIVTTSEYRQMRERLLDLEDQRKREETKSHPTLRIRSGGDLPDKDQLTTDRPSKDHAAKDQSDRDQLDHELQ